MLSERTVMYDCQHPLNCWMPQNVRKIIQYIVHVVLPY